MGHRGRRVRARRHPAAGRGQRRPVIDTSGSFTVSAWVNLANTNGYQTFVSGDGSQVSGFYLQLRGDVNSVLSR